MNNEMDDRNSQVKKMENKYNICYSDYKKGRSTKSPKRILMKVTAKLTAKRRAAARLEAYAEKYDSVSRSVDKIISLEKDIVSGNISSSSKAKKIEAQEGLEEKIEENSYKMATDLVKHISADPERILADARVSSFVDNCKLFRNVKKAKKAKLKKNPFIRLCSMISRRNRKIHKKIMGKYLQYADQAISDNLIDRNDEGDLLYNPRLLDSLKPSTAAETVMNAVDNGLKMPTPVKAISTRAPIGENPVSQVRRAPQEGGRVVSPTTAPASVEPTGRTINLSGFHAASDLTAGAGMVESEPKGRSM